MTDQQNEIAQEMVLEASKAVLAEWKAMCREGGFNDLPFIAPTNHRFIRAAIGAALHRLPTQSAYEELLAAEAENNRLREIVDDMRIEVARITDNAATEIMRLKDALEQIALLDEADGHELTVDHAFQAIAIATTVLAKHPSEIHAERYAAPLSQDVQPCQVCDDAGLAEPCPQCGKCSTLKLNKRAPLSQGGVTLRELGESYCEEQPAPAQGVAVTEEPRNPFAWSPGPLHPAEKE